MHVNNALNNRTKCLLSLLRRHEMPYYLMRCCFLSHALLLGSVKSTQATGSIRALAYGRARLFPALLPGEPLHVARSLSWFQTPELRKRRKRISLHPAARDEASERSPAPIRAVRQARMPMMGNWRRRRPYAGGGRR